MVLRARHPDPQQPEAANAVRRHPGTREAAREGAWTRGHAIWVFDVFAWRGSPAARNEDLRHVVGVTLRAADPEERRKLHRLGDGPAIETMAMVEGERLEVAADTEHRSALLGPYATASEPA